MVEGQDVTKLVDMDSIVAQQEGEPVGLHQIAGKGADRTIRVFPLQRAIIGRGKESAICVQETGVSRRHALVEHYDGKPRLVDLGSTNGTFVNGERIDTSDLSSGDRIQVGSAVFDVTVGREDDQAGVKESTDPGLRREIEQIQDQLQRQPRGSGQVFVQKPLLVGSLETIGLPSLLQTLEANGSSGSLLIHLESCEGHVFFRKGRPIHAKLGRARGKKAMFRLMTVSDGGFEFVTPGFEPDLPTIESTLEGVMLEAVTEVDEFTEYRKDLPPDEASLVFASNRTFVLDRMPPDLFEVLATISRHKTVGSVIDECSLSDLTVCRNLLMLLNEKIIEVAP